VSWFGNLKLSRKLAVGTVLKVGPFLALCGYLGLAFSEAAQNTDALFKNDMAAVNAARDLRFGLVNTGRLMRMQHLAAKDERGRFRGLVDAQRQKMRDALERLQALTLSEAMVRDVELSKGRIDVWSGHVDRVMTANEADRLPEALAALGEARALLDDLEPAANRILDGANALAAAKHKDVMASVERARTTLVVATLAALLIAVLVVWRVTAVITAPVHEMREKLALVGEGDFTQRIENRSADEVGQVAEALNATLEKVSKALGEVRSVATQLTASATELHSSATEISAGASEQASGFEETAASLEEITSTVRTTSENAQQATTLASDSRGAAENGQQVVDTAISAMTDLSKSSRQIADIITTIDEIAFQTNLLALNAAVEAARAGEQGRGFAVVANEVRNLAQRSATSAREIKALIQGSLAKVDSGVQLVNQSGEALRGIVNAVKRVSGLMGDIATASKEQSQGVEQVNKAVLQMDQITQRNAAQTEELTATADRLSASARHLEQTVARFKLTGNDVSAVAFDSRHTEASTPRRAARPAPAPTPRPLSTAGGFSALPAAPFPATPPKDAPEGFQEF
jgi:methyl-accepting chemotaxis protein